MIRMGFLLVAVALVSACGNGGRGSLYSSARAQTEAPVFVPVTPGATPGVAGIAAPTPVTQGVLPGEAVPAAAATPLTRPAPAVLTEPIAITPGAVPVSAQPAIVTQAAVVTPALAVPAVFNPTVQAPVVSLKPKTAPRVGAPARSAPQVIQASASAAAATAPTRAPTAGRRFARGPIYAACRSAGRKEATSRRCGCVQWVADRGLTNAQQRRGAGYFNNQQGVQDARQSDKSADEAFWTAWKAFGQSAAQQCRGS